MDSFILQVFYAIFSGAMEALSISNSLIPMGSPLIAAFSLVPIYIAIYNARNYRQSFVLMMLQALTVHLISSGWLIFFHGYGIFTLGGSAFGTALEAGLCGAIMHIYPSSIDRKSQIKELSGYYPYRYITRVLWFSAAWTFWEWAKSTGDLAYCWGTIYMAAYKLKILTQIADITGVWGITFLFALFNGFLGECWRILGSAVHSQNPSKVIDNYVTGSKAVFALLVIVFAYGMVQYFVPRTVQKEVNTVIVQQNADPWEAGEGQSIEISKRLTEEGIQRFAGEGKEADLVLWSEGVLTHTFPTFADYYEETSPYELGKFIRETNTPFIIGGTTLANRRKRQYCNSAILFDSQGKYSGFYSKIHLVPFAESIPYSENPIMKFIMEDIIGASGGYSKGYQYILFKTPIKERTGTPTPLNYKRNNTATIALDENGISDMDTTREYIVNPDTNPDNYVYFTTPICFEDAFSDVCTPLFNLGSEVFMNITNDSWSKTRAAEYQHFIVASYLALEYRTTLVRCCNSGYSVVVKPNGDILQELPLFEEGVMACSVPIYEHKPTVYSTWGNWLCTLLFTMMGIVTLYVMINIYGSDRMIKIVNCILE